MEYEFLKDNIDKGIHEMHVFPQIKLIEVEKRIKIPLELRNFFVNVGYGFFFLQEGSINRLIDPIDFELINTRKGYYEFAPELEYYETNHDKLIFFEVNEGIYLSIKKEDKDGKNAIYYFGNKIAESLKEFLMRFDKEGHFFE